MLLKIYYYGHPILRKRGESIAEITDEIRKLAKDMIETMDKNDGIGLAAQQVGHAVRMFVLRKYLFTEDGHWTLAEPQVFINPKLSVPGEHVLSDTEGCLSFPKLRLEVSRPAKITVEATDLDGKTFTEELDGYNARVVMHENDHINGVLFIDRIEVNARKKIDPLLRAIKKKFSST